MPVFVNPHSLTCDSMRGTAQCMEIFTLCFGGWAAYLRQAGVDEDAFIGQAHERCAALRAPRIRGADRTAC